MAKGRIGDGEHWRWGAWGALAMQVHTEFELRLI